MCVPAFWDDGLPLIRDSKWISANRFVRSFVVNTLKLAQRYFLNKIVKTIMRQHLAALTDKARAEAVEVLADKTDEWAAADAAELGLGDEAAGFTETVHLL